MNAQFYIGVAILSVRSSVRPSLCLKLSCQNG